MQKNILKKISIGVAAFLLAALLLIVLVFTGILRINTPSKKDFPVWGVDVSQSQGIIDWNKLAGQGVQFAYIKATEGSNHVDSQFETNWQGAAKAGVVMGIYHSFNFESSGAEQSQNIFDVMEGRSGLIPPVINLELSGEHKNNPPDASTVKKELEMLLFRVQGAYSQLPIIYATQQTYNLYLKDDFGRFPLWIRNVHLKPSVDKWTFWQYSDKGNLDGYDGTKKCIDLNVFNGNQEEWQTFLENSKPKVLCSTDICDF